MTMNKKQTAQILALFTSNYPDTTRGEPAEVKEARFNLWYIGLKDFDYSVVSDAAMAFILGDNGKYMPNIGQFRTKIFEQIMSARPQLSEGEAWSMYRKALSRCGSHSQEEFDKLPPVVQRVAGSPYAMRTKAYDTNFNEGVEQSNFFKAYRIALAEEEKRAKEEMIPLEIRQRLAAVAESSRPTGLLGDGTDESIS